MFLIFVLPAALIATFICYTFVRPLAVSVALKWWLCLFFCFCALGLQLARLIVGGNLFAPNLPTPLLKTMVFLYGFTIIFFILLLITLFLTPLLHFILQCCFPKIKLYDWQTIRNFLNLCLLVVAIIASLVGFHNAMLPPVVKHETFTMANLPSQADGTRVAFLVDLHIDGKITARERVEALVKQTNELKPDLIVLGGDFVDGTLDQLKDDVTPLKDLKAPLGVVGVVGNHEYYSGYHDWVNFLPTLGIRLLLNEAITLGNGLRVAGVTDPTESKDYWKNYYPGSFISCDYPPKSVLLIAHQPKIIKQIRSLIKDCYYFFSENYYGPDQSCQYEPPTVVQLSGHTHGGMIPILKLFVAISNNGYLSGRYGNLYVSNGTFLWNGFPFRLFCPGEITLITLRKENLPHWKYN